jgi:hypothetical protein
VFTPLIVLEAIATICMKVQRILDVIRPSRRPPLYNASMNRPNNQLSQAFQNAIRAFCLGAVPVALFFLLAFCFLPHDAFIAKLLGLTMCAAAAIGLVFALIAFLIGLFTPPR